MTINPAARRILCYGDSNTWGQTPDRTGRRYPVGVRWTSVLQSELGGDFSVIEEGLSSRTTDLDYKRKPGRNGRTYLEPCLDSHNPLDFVIIMLGTNDFKIEFDRSAGDIAEALKGLIEIIHAKTAKYAGRAARVLLVSPILVDMQAEMIREWYSAYYDEVAAQKSQELASHLKRIASETGCEFYDAAQVAWAGKDGIHLDGASHDALGKALAAEIKSFAVS